LAENLDSDVITNASGIQRRLDALIRLLVEILTREEAPLELGEAIRALNSAGLTPLEICKILGKDRTDVSWALYGRQRKTKRKR
jgi:hypothetical protein